ncbi:MAG: hypothetical protein PHU95_02340 [Candidatus Thermoplasmatota archaeon]|nr:hypothetical protein [Candidatus Thermoplasmatota archaeon]
MSDTMKKIFTALLCISIPLILVSSNSIHTIPSTENKGNNGEWNREFGGKHADDLCDIQYTLDGCFILAGRTWSFGHGPDTCDAWFLKIDKNGNELVNKTFGGRGYDVAQSVVEAEDGYLIGGYTESLAADRGDFWLIKVDHEGNMLWNKTYDGRDLDNINKVINTGDGYLMVGDIRSPGDDHDSNVWLVKVDWQGNEMWNRTFGGAYTDHGDDVLQTDDGYVISGMSYSYETNGGWDAWLIKVDENGVEQWNRTYGWGQFETRSFVARADDGYVLAGRTEYTPMGGQAFLIKVDERGHQQWSKAYGNGLEHVWDFDRVDDGYVLTGTQSVISVGGSDAWLVRVDEQGNELWTKKLGGPVREGADALVAVDGYYYVAAGKTYTEPFDRNAWIVKCDDTPPPQLTITRPREQYLYLFDREILPTERTIIFGKITVEVEVSDESRIDSVAFYVTVESYEHRPRKVLSEPPYTWTWDEPVIVVWQPAEITVAGRYGGASGIAVDHVWPIWIYNFGI